MSLLSHEDQLIFGEKIKQLIMFVGLLSPDEIETLKQLKESLYEENSTLNTIGGVLVDIDKADHKIARHKAMIKRIDGLVAIHESNLEMGDANVTLAEKQKGKQTINELFGLED